MGHSIVVAIVAEAALRMLNAVAASGVQMAFVALEKERRIPPRAGQSGSVDNAPAQKNVARPVAPSFAMTTALRVMAHAIAVVTTAVGAVAVRIAAVDWTVLKASVAQSVAAWVAASGSVGRARAMRSAQALAAAPFVETMASRRMVSVTVASTTVGHVAAIPIAAWD